jgi:hypothetical protein
MIEMSAVVFGIKILEFNSRVELLEYLVVHEKQKLLIHELTFEQLTRIFKRPELIKKSIEFRMSGGMLDDDNPYHVLEWTINSLICYADGWFYPRELLDAWKLWVDGIISSIPLKVPTNILANMFSMAPHGDKMVMIIYL